MYCREGTLRPGDRLLSVDGIPLHSSSLSDALAILTQCSQEALFQIEYDITIMGEKIHTRTQAQVCSVFRTSCSSWKTLLTPCYNTFPLLASRKSNTNFAHSQNAFLLDLMASPPSPDSLSNASGPLLVEISRSPGSCLGLSLTSANHCNQQVIVVERVRSGSVVDR